MHRPIVFLRPLGLRLERLISTMEKLLKLHKSLYEIAQKKTETVKIGDIDALNQILKDEQAHLKAINLLENERQKFTSSLVLRTEKPTIEDCLAVVDESTRHTLDHLRSELKNVITHELALKMDGAQACYPYPAAGADIMPQRVGRRGGP